MVASVLLFAHLIGAAIEAVPTLVWGFFFGLVLFAVFDVGRARPPAILATLGAVGLVLGVAVSGLKPMEAEASYAAYFLGGAFAVCAWLLPAVSGSFLLVVLGLYTQVLQAVVSLDWSILAIFVLGMATGLALAARLIRYLMDRFFEPLLGFLTGFMAGALVKLWPWQADGALLLPEQWSQAAGSPAPGWVHPCHDACRCGRPVAARPGQTVASTAGEAMSSRFLNCGLRRGFRLSPGPYFAWCCHRLHPSRPGSMAMLCGLAGKAGAAGYVVARLAAAGGRRLGGLRDPDSRPIVSERRFLSRAHLRARASHRQGAPFR